MGHRAPRDVMPGRLTRACAKDRPRCSTPGVRRDGRARVGMPAGQRAGERRDRCVPAPAVQPWRPYRPRHSRRCAAGARPAAPAWRFRRTSGDVRRPSQRDRDAGCACSDGAPGPWTDRRHRGRPRRRQVAPGLGIHSRWSGSRMARAGELVGGARPPHAVPRHGRAAAGLLRRAAWCAGGYHSRQDRPAAGVPGRGSGAAPIGVPEPLRRAGRRSGVASARAAPAATADADGDQASAARGERPPAVDAGVRGCALGRCRNTGAARRDGGQRPGGPHPDAGHLPSRARARLGRAELLHAAAGGTVARGERRPPPR